MSDDQFSVNCMQHVTVVDCIFPKFHGSHYMDPQHDVDGAQLNFVSRGCAHSKFVRKYCILGGAIRILATSLCHCTQNDNTN